MTDKDLININVECLEKLNYEQLQAQSVSAVLLALGSNCQADYHLPRVRKSLSELGEIKLSTAFQNPDFTATKEQPKPDYTNQCLYLSLKEDRALSALQRVFKQIETECGRLHDQESKTSVKRVTMDIDILLIKINLIKNSLSNKCKGKWIVITERYPFKDHELIGLEELKIINDPND